MSDIFPISDKAKELARERQIDQRWEIIEIGQAFAIPLDQTKLTNLRTKASTMGKKLHRVFVVVRHDNCYEIARVG